MEICLFQGTFNPIHNAHLRVACKVVEDLNFDKIIFIPAYSPPHKDSKLDMALHRYNMVEKAISKYEKFEISDIEFKRKGKSYTYLTALELYEKYPDLEKINFIIGTDAFREIKSWYETDKLKKLVNFIVFTRDNDFDEKEFEYLKNDGYKFEFQVLSFLDISSTEIRRKVANGEDISELVPEQVEEYIITNELYKN